MHLVLLLDLPRLASCCDPPYFPPYFSFGSSNCLFDLDARVVSTCSSSQLLSPRRAPRLILFFFSPCLTSLLVLSGIPLRHASPFGTSLASCCFLFWFILLLIWFRLTTFLALIYPSCCILTCVHIPYFTPFNLSPYFLSFPIILVFPSCLVSPRLIAHFPSRLARCLNSSYPGLLIIMSRFPIRLAPRLALSHFPSYFLGKPHLTLSITPQPSHHLARLVVLLLALPHPSSRVF